MAPTAFESASLGVATYKVRDLVIEDGTPVEKSMELFLVLDMNALAKVKEQLGVDLLDREKWVWGELDAQQVTVVLWCSMNRFHPEVALDYVRRLAPVADIWKVPSRHNAQSRDALH